MTRAEFLQEIAKLGWYVAEVNPTWIRIAQQPDYPLNHKEPIEPTAPIEVVITREGQINLLVPSQYIDLCPGLPGQVRHFRVIASDWQDVWNLVREMYQLSTSPGFTFYDAVLLAIPAERLLADDYTFFMNNRGEIPIWRN